MKNFFKNNLLFVLFFTVITIISQSNYAKDLVNKLPQKKVVQQNNKSMFMNIQFGDKISKIQVKTDKTFEVSINEDFHSGELNDKNYNYLFKVSREVMKKQNNKAERCPRSFAYLRIDDGTKIQEKLACVQSKTPVANEMRKLMTALALL